MDIVRDVISLGVDVHKLNRQGHSYLSMIYGDICHRDRMNINGIKLLLELGLDINYYSNRSKYSAMYMLCNSGIKAIDVIKYLLERGIDKKLLDWRGEEVAIETITKCPDIINLYNNY